MNLLNVLKCAMMAVEGINENANPVVKLESFLVVQADSSEYKVPVVADERGLVVEFPVSFFLVPRDLKGCNSLQCLISVVPIFWNVVAGVSCRGGAERLTEYFEIVFIFQSRFDA